MDAAVLSREMLSLLEVRESALVPAWAAQCLGGLLGASQARALHVYPVAAARRKDAGGTPYAVASDDDAAPQPVPLHSDLWRAIDGRRTASGEGALYVPLAAFGEVRHVVQLSGI